MTKYFLFGAIAKQVYYDYGMDSVIRNLDSLDCTVYELSENDRALDLLEAYDGWGGYAMISREDYEMLKEKINLHNSK